jgi:hypothetical protein
MFILPVMIKAKKIAAVLLILIIFNRSITYAENNSFKFLKIYQNAVQSYFAATAVFDVKSIFFKSCSCRIC